MVPIFTAKINIPFLNVVEKAKIYYKTLDTDKFVYNSMIILISFIIALFLNNTVMYKLFRRRTVPSIIGLLLSFAIIIASIIGIIYFTNMLVDINNRYFHISTSDKINIVIVDVFCYLAFGLSIISALFCSGVSISYFVNRK
jgi:hypothetical protein